MFGGLYLFFNSNSLIWIYEAFNSLPSPAMAWLIKSAFWCLLSLCLMSGTLALLACNRPETSWQHRLGVAGSIVNLLGVVAYLVGCLYVVILQVEDYACHIHQGFYFR